MNDDTITMEAHTVALATARQEAHEAGRRDGATAGAEAAATRFKAILGHSEAAGREAQARSIAFDTNLTAEQAGALLATGAKQSAPTLAERAAAGTTLLPTAGPSPEPGKPASDFDRGREIAQRFAPTAK